MKKILLLLVCLPTIITAQWTTRELSESKFYTQAAAVMGKALFIGGAMPGFVPSKKVEIYDFAANTWESSDMQTGRVLAGVVVADSLVFIAGGLNPQTGSVYSEVEIYDAKNKQWKTSLSLSIPRANIAAIRAGQELWFAGGYMPTGPTSNLFFDVIDIYDLDAGKWSTKILSVPRICSGAVLGNNVIFAGGQADNGPVAVADIYNTQTGQTSTVQLSVPRMNMAVATAGQYILFAGGSTYTEDALDVVDIWNTGSDSWATYNLSAPRAFIGAGSVCDSLAVFAGGGNANWAAKFLTSSSNRVDIFNASNGTWSQDTLAFARTAAFAAADSKYFFMGGGWHPESSELLKSVEFYTCPLSSGIADINEAQIFSLSPNPGLDEIRVHFNDKTTGRIEVFDLSGRMVLRQDYQGNDLRINVSSLQSGQYIVSVYTDRGGHEHQRWIKAQ